jgi:hypothetical protein
MSSRFPKLISGVALFGALILPSLSADEWDKKTTITISEPVQMPSCCTPDHTVTLPAGTYVFALVDSLSDRHIVRVFEKDGKTVVTTILAIPNYRLTPTDKTSIQFWETPAGQPRAMRAWFYPGDNFGQEFAYYKTQSLEIAKVAKAPVPTFMAEQETELKTTPLFTFDEQGTQAPLKSETPPTHEADRVVTPEPAAPVEVKPDPVPVKTDADQVAPSEPVPSTDPAPVSLPHTASPFPLIGLFGLGSLAFSGLLSRLSKRG